MKLFLMALIFSVAAAANAVDVSHAPKPDRVEIYKKIGDLELHLDEFFPAGWKASDRRPAIVFFHGGSWTSGTPALFHYQSRYLADEGMVAVSVNYRLGKANNTTPFDAVEDAKSAIRWVRGHAGELGIDPERVAAGGGSAGGHLAAAAATVPGLDADPKSPISPVPNALVLFNPVFDNGPQGFGYETVGDRYKEISPIDNIRKGMPPALAMFGTQDKFVPVATAKRFQALMQAAGSRSELKIYEGQQHGFFNYLPAEPGGGEYYKATMGAATNFLVSLGYIEASAVKPAGGEAGSSSAAGEAAAVGSAEARFGLKFPAVDFTPPGVNRVTLENGIRLEHYAEKEVPLVTVLVRVANGSVNDTADKVGTAQMTGEVIRNGGSKDLPGDALDRELESRGATLDVSSDREETWFRLSVLPEDAEWGMKILSDLLAHPALPAEKLEEARGRAVVDLRQRLDEPASSAQALFPQLIYGKGNPWGWTMTERTLGALTVDDLRAMYERHYRTNDLMLGVAGDLDLERAKKLAAKYFGPETFKKTEASQSAPPPVEPIAQTRVYIAERGASQNVVAFGHEGISRFSDEKFPVKLFNLVLSGGFTSRLFKQVRSNRGLAYTVYGRIGEGTVRGIYSNIALTKAASTTDTLLLMIQVNKDLQAAAPEKDEVELARQGAVNGFVFLFDTAEQMVKQNMTLDGFGYPPDYLKNYVSNLKKVTPEEIRAAAQKDLHPDKIVVLVLGTVGDAAREDLKKLGPVTVISDEQLKKEWL